MTKFKQELKNFQNPLITFLSLMIILLLFFVFNISISKLIFPTVKANDFALSIDISILTPILNYCLQLLFAYFHDLLFVDVKIKTYLKSDNNANRIILMPPSIDNTSDNYEVLYIDVQVSKKTLLNNEIKIVVPNWFGIQLEDNNDYYYLNEKNEYIICLKEIKSKRENLSYGIVLNSIVYSNYSGKNDNEIGFVRYKGKFFNIEYKSVIMLQGE